MRGWKIKQTTENINSIREPWLQGYFTNDHYNWDGKTWTRKFTELRT